MKGKMLLIAMIMLLMTGSTVYAQSVTGTIQTEEVELTDENRFDSKYYQEPEIRYPVSSVQTYGAASTALTLEEYVVNALQNLQATIDVSAYQIPKDKAGETFFQILNNNPGIFYVVNRISYSYNSANIVTLYKVTYTDTEENIRKQQQELENKANQAIAQVDAFMSDVEKALVVHDYLILNCEYDYDNYLKNTIPDSSYNAYGALVKETAVCQGYAESYSYIMEDKLGISCKVVSSDGMNHAWNMILVDGSWYHVDTTWDDPTWDCIGRVCHSYFLLSDEAIKDSSHKHYGWESEYTATSDTYDTAFWSDINSAILPWQGAWYYSKYNTTVRNITLIKQSGLFDGSQETVYTENGSWNYYSNSYMYLDQAQDKIYFNTRTDMRSLDEDGIITTVYAPSLSGSNLIFGFTVKEDKLYYALQETPNLNSSQQILTYTLPELQTPEMEGISAEDVYTVYDGTAKTITINGTVQGDTVFYAGKDGTYSSQQPEMVQAGTYYVYYRVKRTGYQTFHGTAKLVIAKAAPKYEVPTGLQGNSGKTLGTVKLPQGFTWSSADTVLYKEGTYTYYVNYEPEDSVNYETVTDIEVKVKVTCPGHQYTSTVTKEPTNKKPGEETYTCKLCGDTYTKEITANNTDNPAGNESGKPAGVKGLTIKKATTTSLKFSWNKVNNAKYCLKFYNGNKLVSTQYTGKNSYTYNKLKAATVYTLKITSYKETNGKKVYSDSTASLKTATAPQKVTLSSVKKSGSSKGKLTWKKVTGASGYEIYMKTGSGSFKKVKTVTKGKTTTYVQKKLKKGKKYTFKVRAYVSAGKQKVYGSYSSSKVLNLK